MVGNKPLIYLDNCCFNRPYDDQSQLKINIETLAKLKIQEAVRDEKILLTTSYVLVAENTANPSNTKKTDIQRFIDKYTYAFVSRNKENEIIQLAEDIMQTGIKYMDACHVASAIIAGCDYFISTDKRLLKYESEKIRLINPVTFVIEEEDRL